MTGRLVTAEGEAYVFFPDAPMTAADRPQTIARARLRDEITGEAPRAEVTLSVPRPGLRARVAEGGLVGLVGVPRQAFPSGGIAGLVLPFTIAAEGYLPVAVAPSLPAQPLYPDVFQPIDLGVLDLQRVGVVLRGRAVREVGGTRTPLVGAQITPTAVRLTPNGAAVAIPAAVSPLTIQTGLRRGRAAGAVVRRRDLVIGGAAKRLLLPTAAGARRARLSDRIGLALGALVAFDAGDDERGETVAVSAIEATPTLDQPAWVDLDLPLTREHREGGPVAPATLGAAGANNLLTRDAALGDRCLFLDGAAGLPGAATVEITGGGPTEYHAAQRLLATSDGEGFWRLPAVARVATVTLHGQHAAAANPAVVEVAIDYRLPENRVDLVFR